MSPPGEDRVIQLADRFVSSIARLGQNNSLSTMRTFPLGACGDVALLFARCLYQNGFVLPEYVAGACDDGRTHAWIEADGLIIDLATGQFPDAPERVMITRDSSWHAQFKEQRRHPADIGLYDENTRKCLLEAYDQIISNFSQSSN
jgi:hypothetical protein